MVRPLNKNKHSALPYIVIPGSNTYHSANQKKWIVLTVLIATYGFLKNTSPESPYMAEFFIGPRFNFTTTQVTQEIYPVSVYSSVVQIFIVLLVTDILRYKPIIVFGAFGFLVHKTLLVWGHSLLEMQANQFFWGTSKACSLAYKTYIYNKVDREHFQFVTAIIRIAPKAGTLFSSILSQVSLSIFQLSIEQLNKISLAASLMALLCAILLPPLKKSVYFSEEKMPQLNGTNSGKRKYMHAVQLLWQDFKDAYTNPYIVKWCVWWVLATGGFQQVTDYYVQVLWSEISRENRNKYNAGVEAVYTIVSGMACYLIGGLKVDWHRKGEGVLAICTLLKGAALLYNASTHSILISYGLYIAFCTMYDVMIVISNSEVAKHLKNESFALIFGTNTFLALCCQSLLTYVLTSKNMLALPIRDQFIGISCGFLLLGIGFALRAIFKLIVSPKNMEVQNGPTKFNEVSPIITALKISQKIQIPTEPDVP